MTTQFSADLRNQVNDELKSLLDSTEHFLSLCETFSRTNTATWMPNPASKLEFPRLYNRYLEMLYAIYLTKFTQLTTSLVKSVNTSDYITYALVGRSMLEHTATLRYYWKKRLGPIMETASSRGGVVKEETVAVIDALDKHLRGTRFDWVSFELRDYESLHRSQTSRRKRASGSSKGTESKNTPPEQINTVTTIDHWAKDERAVRITYDLFCDLVHPNIGSNFLIMSSDGTALGVNPSVQSSVGFSIFCRSFPLLVSTAIRESSLLVPMLSVARYQDDEL